MKPELMWLGVGGRADLRPDADRGQRRNASGGTAGARRQPRGAAALHRLGGRAQRAHHDVLENLVLFAALVLIAVISNKTNATTVLGAQIFFWARLVYAGVYLAGIPWLRTLVVAGFGRRHAAHFLPALLAGPRSRRGAPPMQAAPCSRSGRMRARGSGAVGSHSRRPPGVLDQVDARPGRAGGGGTRERQPGRRARHRAALPASMPCTTVCDERGVERDTPRCGAFTTTAPSRWAGRAPCCGPGPSRRRGAPAPRPAGAESAPRAPGSTPRPLSLWALGIPLDVGHSNPLASVHGLLLVGLARPTAPRW